MKILFIVEIGISVISDIHVCEDLHLKERENMHKHSSVHVEYFFILSHMYLFSILKGVVCEAEEMDDKKITGVL